MISVVVRTPNGGTAIHRFELNEINIGSAPGSNVVLEGAEPRHARVLLRDGRFIIVDLKTTLGTYVNTRKLTSPLVIRETDQITIGDHVFSVVPTQPPPLEALDETEARFLELVEARPQSDDERIVYCDWLEEHGFVDRAEFLRLQIHLRDTTAADPAFHAGSERLRALGQLLDVRWRAIVARPALENCDVRFELRCPKRWDQLVATDSDTVRLCHACERNVIYCATIQEARRIALAGGCVAVDVSVERKAHDLEPQQPPMMLGRLAPPR